MPWPMKSRMQSKLSGNYRGNFNASEGMRDNKYCGREVIDDACESSGASMSDCNLDWLLNLPVLETLGNFKIFLFSHFSVLKANIHWKLLKILKK